MKPADEKYKANKQVKDMKLDGEKYADAILRRDKTGNLQPFGSKKKIDVLDGDLSNPVKDERDELKRFYKDLMHMSFDTAWKKGENAAARLPPQIATDMKHTAYDKPPAAIRNTTHSIPRARTQATPQNPGSINGATAYNKGTGTTSSTSTGQTNAAMLPPGPQSSGPINGTGAA